MSVTLGHLPSKVTGSKPSQTDSVRSHQINSTTLDAILMLEYTLETQRPFKDYISILFGS